MIEFMQRGYDNVVGIRAGGKLTDADYKSVLIPRLESMFDRFRKLKVLFLMVAWSMSRSPSTASYAGQTGRGETFVGWDLAATWDNTVLNLRHRSDFEKIAIVGGPVWEQWCAKLTGLVMKGELRTFRRDQLHEAWEWIRA